MDMAVHPNVCVNGFSELGSKFITIVRNTKIHETYHRHGRIFYYIDRNHNDVRHGELIDVDRTQSRLRIVCHILDNGTVSLPINYER